MRHYQSENVCAHQFLMCCTIGNKRKSSLKLRETTPLYSDEDQFPSSLVSCHRHRSRLSNRTALSNRRTMSWRSSSDLIESCFCHFFSSSSLCCSFFNETTKWRDPRTIAFFQIGQRIRRHVVIMSTVKCSCQSMPRSNATFVRFRFDADRRLDWKHRTMTVRQMQSSSVWETRTMNNRLSQHEKWEWIHTRWPLSNGFQTFPGRFTKSLFNRLWEKKFSTRFSFDSIRDRFPVELDETIEFNVKRVKSSISSSTNLSDQIISCVDHWKHLSND